MEKLRSFYSKNKKNIHFVMMVVLLVLLVLYASLDSGTGMLGEGETVNRYYWGTAYQANAEMLNEYQQKVYAHDGCERFATIRYIQGRTPATYCSTLNDGILGNDEVPVCFKIESRFVDDTFTDRRDVSKTLWPRVEVKTVSLADLSWCVRAGG